MLKTSLCPFMHSGARGYAYERSFQVEASLVLTDPFYNSLRFVTLIDTPLSLRFWPGDPVVYRD